MNYVICTKCGSLHRFKSAKKAICCGKLPQKIDRKTYKELKEKNG